MMTHELRLKFLKEEVPALIMPLQSSDLPKWGKMGAQQMVEHLSMSLAIANGKIKVTEFITAEDKLPIMKRFILSDTPFKENTKSPALSDKLPALKYASLDEAKGIFNKTLQALFAVYEANAQLIIRNPVFGDLNYEEQAALITKHIRHHFNQFGLMKAL
jgi:hypothetical protein